MKRLRAIMKGCGATLAILLIAGSTWWAVQPIPVSPPLQDAQGVVLDPEMEAKLVEVVFDAARGDDVVTIDEYLKSGFSPNVRSPRGDTLLAVAAYNDSPHVVTVLLAHKEIELEARNRMGLTATTAAAFKGHTEILKQLIAAGANVNAENSSRQTALMFASLAGRKEAVRLLLDAGARRDRTDLQGQTAARIAAGQGATEVVQILQGSLPITDTAGHHSFP